jgi:hypothetical protein
VFIIVKKDFTNILEIFDYTKEHYDSEESKRMLHTTFRELYEKYDISWGEEDKKRVDSIFNSIYNKARNDTILKSAKLNGLALDKLNENSTHQS